MWSEIPAFLLGLVTLAVTADLFTRRSSRTLRILHAQAQLLPLLPAGPGRDELAHHVDAQVARYLTELQAPPAGRGPREVAVLAIAFAAAFVWIGGASLGAVWDDRPDWVQNVSLSALVVLVLSTTFMAVAARRAR